MGPFRSIGEERANPGPNVLDRPRSGKSTRRSRAPEDVGPGATWNARFAPMDSASYICQGLPYWWGGFAARRQS